VAAGKVRYVGLCNLPSWVAAQAHTISHFRGWTPATALQVEYSLLERTAEGELLPMAGALGMGVLPWSPLRGGQILGKSAADSPRARVMGRPADGARAVVDTVARIAAETGVSPAEVALAWVRGRSAVTSTLVGARTVAQLRANLASLDVTLTPEHRAELDTVSAPALDFPAEINAGPGPMLGFGGTTVDDVARPVWPSLLANAARY
jgi:aryl-alcohol dehydrogenase-like predicted oxidoreductase